MIGLQRRTFTPWRIFAVFFIALVWAASVLPNTPLPVRFEHADKVGHFLAYALIAYLLNRGWPALAWYWILAITLICGGVAEIGQAVLTTTRRPDWWDMLASAAGALVGILACRLTRPPAPRSPQ